MSSTQIVWKLTLPLTTTVVAALVTVSFTQMQAQFPSKNVLTSCLGYYGLHVVLLMASIWFLQRTSFWRRRSRLVHTWQYSLAHLLIVMTIVAVLSTLMRNNLFFRGGEWLNIAFACSYVALALASVFLWSFSWHWVFRLASVLGLAVLLGAFGYTLLTVSMGAGGAGAEPLSILLAFYLTQACVLTVWLGSGFILPMPNSEISVSSQSD